MIAVRKHIGQKQPDVNINTKKKGWFETKEETTFEYMDSIETPQVQKVFLLTAFDKPWSMGSIPMPEPHENEILVYNKAVGLNPIDWKSKKYKFGVYSFPWINGRESSGVVVKRGNKVTNVEIGDHVIVSSTSYRDNRTSTFQEYSVIDSRLVWKLPESFTHREGATIGVGLVTASLVLFKSFNLKPQMTQVKNVIPDHQTLVIWGGSTVVGMYLTQISRILGLNVIVIASTRYKRYLLELGANKVIDRHESLNQIQAQLPENIHYAVDCISSETSAILLDILAKNKSIIGQFVGIVAVPKSPIPANVAIRDLVIKLFHENIKFGSYIVSVTDYYLNAGLIKPVKFRSYEGGLHRLHEALYDLEVLGAHGEKYVVTL